MSEHLKPCPFCRGEAYTRTVQDEDLSTHNIVDWHFVGCSNCDFYFGIPDGYDCGSSREQWNRRADLPPTLEQALEVPEVKALVEALEDLLEATDLSHGEINMASVQQGAHDALAALGNTND